MKQRLSNLVKRIRSELIDLTQIIYRIEEGWQRAKQANDDYYLDSVALNLHGLYSGLETLFALIATDRELYLPQG